MKAVTIDKLNISDHLRWAQDQELLDSVYLKEAPAVAPHPELVGLSIIYPSRFDELFELSKNSQHWACFSPPERYLTFGKRFFSHRLFTTLCSYKDEEESGGEEKEKEEENDQEDSPEELLIQAVLRIKKLGAQTSSLLEKDKGTLISLLESIHWINKLLAQINARRLQYQKG